MPLYDFIGRQCQKIWQDRPAHPTQTSALIIETRQKLITCNLFHKEKWNNHSWIELEEDKCCNKINRNYKLCCIWDSSSGGRVWILCVSFGEITANCIPSFLLYWFVYTMSTDEWINTLWWKQGCVTEEEVEALKQSQTEARHSDKKSVKREIDRNEN